MTSTLVILWISELWDMFLLCEFKDVKQQRCSHNQQISVRSGIFGIIALRVFWTCNGSWECMCTTLDFCEWWYFDAIAFWVFHVDM